jgi:hypothetical protein
MANLVYKIILMTSVYIILGCSFYIARQIQVHMNKELTKLTAIIFYISWIVFLPVIAMCMYVDILRVDYTGYVIEMRYIFKEIERHEGRKSTKAEKKEIRALLKRRINEGNVEDYE